MIALELYTLRRLLSDPERIPGVLERVREIGYPAVELAGLGPIAPDRLQQALARADLIACAAHVPWPRLRDQADQVIEECRLLGHSLVVVPALPGEYRSRDGYARFAAEASEVAPHYQEAGVRLGYHNHAFELQRFGAETALGMIFRLAPQVVAEVDTYWVQYGGGSPEAWIRRLARRLPLVHVKDMDGADGQPGLARIGEGDLEGAGPLAAR